MTESAIAYTRAPGAAEAARELSEQLTSRLAGAPDALVLFASPRYDHATLLRELKARAKPKLLVGASSAGEFTSDVQGEGLACALALRSEEMCFTAGVGRGVSNDRAVAAREIVSAFRGRTTSAYAYRSALVMTDALAGYADDLVDQLTLVTSGSYQFFGGGAGDNAQFQRTVVFHDTETLTDAAVALEILTKKPIGVGVGHGWKPASSAMRVTEARGMTLVGVNGHPAVEAFEAHARETGQTLDRAAPLPFFLHNILGIDTPVGYRLRVPLAVDAAGSVTCAAEIPEGAKIHIMRTDAASAVAAAARATEAAIRAIGDNTPKVALFFDCVATRFRMGDEFGLELGSIANLLGQAGYVGCNTHGQIARAEGQFGGFHNCTAVVCVLPA